jgi:hypothetical protein
VLFIANGPGNDPHNPALGRILSEQDIKMARIADARIAEVFDRLDISTLSGVMDPVAESCGRDAQVSARVGAHKKI